MFVCPKTRTTLEAWYSNASDTLYPHLDEIPVLVSDPRAFLRRHGPWHPSEGVAGQVQEILPVSEPDAVTPFLSPGELGVGGPFGDALLDLGTLTPDAWCASIAVEHAPQGPAVDVGCGLGNMARIMAKQGRAVIAFDRSPNAVLLARDILTGRITEALMPTHAGGAKSVQLPNVAVDTPLRLVIADARFPPLRKDSAAWVHLGMLIDELKGEDLVQALLESVQLLTRGGVLSITTAYDSGGPSIENEPSPVEELREVFEELGLRLIQERDVIPRVVRHHERRFTVQLVHAMVFMRVK